MVFRFVYGCNHNSLQERCELYRVVCLGHSRARPVFTRVCPCTRPCLRPMYTDRLRPVCTAVFTACVYARLHGPWLCAGRVYGRVHDRLCLSPSIQTLSRPCAGRLHVYTACTRSWPSIGCVHGRGYGHGRVRAV